MNELKSLPTPQKATKRKIGFGEKAKKVLLSVDTPDLKTSIVDGVIKPGIKNLVFDAFKNVGTAVTDTVGTLIFGDDYRKKKKKKGNGGGLMYWNGYNYPTVPQTTLITATGQSQSINKPSPTKASWAFDEYAFPTQAMAQELLDDLKDIIETRGRCPAYEFFDHKYVDVSWDYTAKAWGWNDLSNAKISYIGGEAPWIIDFPPVTPINK